MYIYIERHLKHNRYNLETNFPVKQNITLDIVDIKECTLCKTIRYFLQMGIEHHINDNMHYKV